MPSPFVSGPSSAQALLAGFAVEEKSLRTTELVRKQWNEEGAARAQRKQQREAALNARAVAEAHAARVAEEARQAALAEQRRRDELAAIAAEEARKLAAAEAEKLAAEAAKLAAEGEELAARQRDYERRMQERNAQLASPPGGGAMGVPLIPVAHPVGYHPPAPAPVAGAAAAAPGVGASAALYGSSLPAAPTPQQAAFQRSFQELTGVANMAQISMLLTLLNHDLDRAIAVFFSEDPPSMINALEKARSIQANAQQQQQQQQAQHHVSPLASMQVQGGGGQPAYIPAYRQYIDANAQGQPAQPMQPSQQQPQGHPTQLKVLMPDGSPFIANCQSTDTMWTLYEQLSAPLSSRPQWANKPIVFALTTYPNTVYNENRWDTTMQEAGLVPQGTLKIELCK